MKKIEKKLISLPRSSKALDIKEFIKDAKKVYTSNKRDDERICKIIEEHECRVCTGTI